MAVGIQKTGYLLNKECAHLTPWDMKEITPPVHNFFVGFVNDQREGDPIQTAPTKVGWAQLLSRSEIWDSEILNFSCQSCRDYRGNWMDMSVDHGSGTRLMVRN